MEDITREQFDAFIAVRDSGETNMMDSNKVAQLAWELQAVELSLEDVRTIRAHFDELYHKFDYDV